MFAFFKCEKKCFVFVIYFFNETNFLIIPFNDHVPIGKKDKIGLSIFLLDWQLIVDTRSGNVTQLKNNHARGGVVFADCEFISM